MEEKQKDSFWNAEKAVSAVEQFVKKYGRLPVAKEMIQENGLPSRRTFESKVGISFFEYGRQYYPELVKLSELRHRERISDSMRGKTEWTKEMLIDAVRHFVDQYDRLPEMQEYNFKNDLPSYTTFCRIAEIDLTDYLKNYFYEYLNQTPSLKEDDTDVMEQDRLRLSDVY